MPKKNNDKIQYIKTNEALARASEFGIDVCRVTMVKWFRLYELGVKIGGVFYYDEKKVMDFLRDPKRFTSKES